MPRRIDLTLDCHDVARIAEFWKRALGYDDEPPPEPFASREEWLDHHGVPAEERDDAAWLHDPSGHGPRLSILKVPEGKVAKNRLHMDLHVSDGPGSTGRWDRIVEISEDLTDAGGAVITIYDDHHIVMRDPEGNEFCIL